ncbi:hypothetical protein QUF58_01450 [Anaerolineales bacterium HSG24]|nr:hypothetical protein [Anaerolineales bacterium HSG24]
MQQQVDAGLIQLQTAEWAKLNHLLERKLPLLETEEPDEAVLKDVAWLIIAAFRENDTLEENFSEQLTALRRGTVATGRPLKRPKKQTLLIQNNMILLNFIKQTKEQAQKGQGKQDKQK